MTRERDKNAADSSEGEHVDPIEEATRKRRLMIAEARKLQNTDAVPTQPIRCIRNQ